MVNVRIYSLKEDGYKHLSKDFRVKEFACKNGSDYVLVCPETVQILQTIRDYFGQPVTINSAYRTPAYNKSVGGVSNSQHVKGTAADIVVKGVPSWAVAAFLEDKYHEHGIGYYNNFTHVDARGYKSYWQNKGSGNISVTTFGLGKKYEKYKAEEEMTIKEIKTELLKDDEFIEKAAKVYLDKKSKESGSNWSSEARNWAIKAGLFSGDSDGYHWKSGITREQIAQVLYNQYKRELDDGK